MDWRYEDKGTACASFADPHQAFDDVREGHAWATRELAAAEPQSRSTHPLPRLQGGFRPMDDEGGFR